MFRRLMGKSLSTKMLSITILAIMFVEVVLLIPSIANFRQTYLREKLRVAEIMAALVEASPDMSVPMALEDQILASAGIEAVLVRSGDIGVRFDVGDSVEHQTVHDLRSVGPPTLIADAFRDMFFDYDKRALVRGEGTLEGVREVSMIIDLSYLHDAMLIYSRNVLLLSLGISAFAGLMIFLAVRRVFIRPLDRMMTSIIAFRSHPLEAPGYLETGNSNDELGVAEQELAQMQEALSNHIQSERKLASLGRGMAKVNHDLRNILATMQMQTDRLADIDDPLVQKLSGRLVRAAERAITLCERTLRYARAERIRPDKEPIALHRVVNESCAAALGLEESDNDEESDINLINDVPVDLTVNADSGQIFRVFLNLARNARQALEAAGTDNACIRVSCQCNDHVVQIQFEDNGPGIPSAVMDKLFLPFGASTSQGGSGLGLSIVQELVDAHGGTVNVDKQRKVGTAIIISLPGHNAQ